MDALNAKVDEYLGENRDIEGVSVPLRLIM